MPDPKQYDNKDDFFKVCIPQVIKEGKDNDQAVAQCNSMWEDKKEMKLETVNVKDVEIFEVGEWKGDKYIEKDLDEMAENFNNNVAEPYITIDHSDKATAQFKDALQALALGFVSKLRRKGKKLVADFKQVPKTIAELIEAGALKKKSIEFSKQFIVNGNLYKNVLQGVTFHGANGLPEVNTLSDYLNLYKGNLQVMDNDLKGIVSLKNSDFKQEVTMSDDLIKLKEDMAVIKNQLTKLQEENEEKDKVIEEKEAEVTEKEKEIVEKDETIKENEEKEKEELKKEAIDYIVNKINNGFLKPTTKEDYIELYIECKNKNDERFKRFKNDIEGRTKIVNFNPTEYPENTNITNFKYDPEKTKYKAGATINYKELNEQVEAIMKAKNISFKEACVTCGVAVKEEFGYEKEA